MWHYSFQSSRYFMFYTEVVSVVFFGETVWHSKLLGQDQSLTHKSCFFLRYYKKCSVSNHWNYIPFLSLTPQKFLFHLLYRMYWVKMICVMWNHNIEELTFSVPKKNSYVPNNVISCCQLSSFLDTKFITFSNKHNLYVTIS